MRVEILPVTEADIENIASLARIIWQNTYIGIITQSQIDYMLEQRYSAEVMLEELKTPGIWWDKLLQDGQMVAFASTLPTKCPGEVKLDKIYIHPEKQRLGLGGRLIEHVSQRALQSGKNSVILAVNKQNEKAINAYKKRGFVVRESVYVDIGDGFVMDDFIMAKQLS